MTLWPYESAAEVRAAITKGVAQARAGDVVSAEELFPRGATSDETSFMCECSEEAADHWFDRTVCPEPCGMMHHYCSTCGRRSGRCGLDQVPPESRPPIYANERCWAVCPVVSHTPRVYCERPMGHEGPHESRTFTGLPATTWETR